VDIDVIDRVVNNDVNKIILISDIHIGVRNNSSEWVEIIEGYVDNFLIPLINKEKESGNLILIIAGDVFDNRQTIDINTMTVMLDIMNRLSNLLTVYMITGNHDIYKKNDNSITSLKVFDSLNNVIVLKNITELRINKLNILLIPWVGDAKTETDILNNNKERDVIIMHSDISGMQYDNGRDVTNGTDVSSFKGRHIYSGHIHKRQEWGKVTYIGSPYQLRRSDINNTKGIYILDLEDSGYEERFIKNKYSPIFIKMNIDEVVNMNPEDLKLIVVNNYIDVVIPEKKVDDYNISDLIKSFDNFGARKLTIIIDNSDSFQIENINTEKCVTIGDVVEDAIKSISDLSDEKRHSLIKLNNKYLTSATEELDSENNVN
jgi:DNA repair exonuclease SbcCD nuclease subunit